jgi:hypothetical protein
MGVVSMSRSAYYVDSWNKEFVFIVDMNMGMSVTNDAENVVEEVVREYGNKRVVYRDSTGRWDELVHEDGKFSRFAPYTGPTPQNQTIY